ncbi:MAG TPA: bifunctional adenosylcobinamide kinase/adenosylcobinamide-phosphate guanylyltransferase [Actinocrinis sp.]|nr:bifunctional adenosylcobinamide kinase/adenosylcobinamide-phosphate guanylyltransferase [Actinocrinis sp.]
MEPHPPTPTRTLILGGARSGKSAEAERLLAEAAAAFAADPGQPARAEAPPALYVATGGTRAGDAEWAERISAHRARRPAAWATAETTQVAGLLRAAEQPVLVDCLTLWLTDAMDRAGAWDEQTWRSGGSRALADRVEDLAGAWQSARVPVIAVSNEVGLGIVPQTAAVRRFRDEQGRLNQRIAAVSDRVVLMVAGIAVPVR